jgi:hypothetical protein
MHLLQRVSAPAFRNPALEKPAPTAPIVKVLTVVPAGRGERRTVATGRRSSSARPGRSLFADSR